jgi:hypothetical protein
MGKIMHKMLLGILILSISFHKNTAFFNVTLSDDKLTVNGQEIKNTTKAKKLLVNLAVSVVGAAFTYNFMKQLGSTPDVREKATVTAAYTFLVTSEILTSNNRKKKVLKEVVSYSGAKLAESNTYTRAIIGDHVAFGVSLGKVAAAITDGNYKKAVINVARTCGEQVGVHILKDTTTHLGSQYENKARGNAIGGNCAAALAAQALEGPELRNSYLAKGFIESMTGPLISRYTRYSIDRAEKFLLCNIPFKASSRYFSVRSFSDYTHETVQKVAGKRIVPVISKLCIN